MTAKRPTGAEPSTPVQAVRAAIVAGAGTLAGIARTTGLDPDVVDAVVAHLIRTGVLESTTLSVGCPDGGCGTCASGDSGPGNGCGAEAPSADRRGPVLVALSLQSPRP